MEMSICVQTYITCTMCVHIIYYDKPKPPWQINARSRADLKGEYSIYLVGSVSSIAHVDAVG